jgi:hypothetical protein
MNMYRLGVAIGVGGAGAAGVLATSGGPSGAVAGPVAVGFALTCYAADQLARRRRTTLALPVAPVLDGEYQFNPVKELTRG